MKHCKKSGLIILFFLCLILISSCNKKDDIMISKVYEETSENLELVVLSKKVLKSIQVVSLNQQENIMFKETSNLNMRRIVDAKNKRKKYYVSIIEVKVNVPCKVNQLTILFNNKDKKTFNIGNYEKIICGNKNDKIITSSIENELEYNENLSIKSVVEKKLEVLSIKNNEKEGVIICGIKPINPLNEDFLKIEVVLSNGVSVIKPSGKAEIATIFIEPTCKIAVAKLLLEISYIYNGNMYKTYYEYKTGYTKEIINNNFFNQVFVKDAFEAIYEK